MEYLQYLDIFQELSTYEKIVSSIIIYSLRYPCAWNGMSDSIKFNDSYLEKFNDNLNRIFKFYYQSAVRRQELKQIAEIFENNFTELVLWKNIHWIASWSRALNFVE